MENHPYKSNNSERLRGAHCCLTNICSPFQLWVAEAAIRSRPSFIFSLEKLYYSIALFFSSVLGKKCIKETFFIFSLKNLFVSNNGNYSSLKKYYFNFHWKNCYLYFFAKFFVTLKKFIHIFKKIINILFNYFWYYLLLAITNLFIYTTFGNILFINNVLNNFLLFIQQEI